MRFLGFRRLAFLLMPILCGASDALAAEESLADRERQLVELVQRLERRVEVLEKRLDERDDPESPAREFTPPESWPVETPDAIRPEDMRAYWKDGVRMETEDGRFELRIGGRLQTDWAWFK